MKSDSKTVDELLAESTFSEELYMLRDILLSTGLEETIKWGAPVYTYDGKNVVGITGFKAHFGLWFFQGALLSDPKKKLLNAQEGKTKAMLQWRMTSKKDIDERLIKSYIREAIENEKQGRRIETAKPIRKAPPLPAELKAALSASVKLTSAFQKLTPGKQKEYAEYISSAKQAATKETRIKKIKPMILSGKGMNDAYK